MNQIEAVAFNGPLGTLRGMLHRPDTTDPAPVIMLLHGFTGHHIEDHRLYVQMARHLAAAGFAALRFDFYGSGDSDGEFEDFTVLTQVADAVAALDWIGQQPGLNPRRIGVVGLSLGGLVTALLAGQDTRVGAVVFWNAVGSPKRHLDDITQSAVSTGIIGGLRVGKAFAETFHMLSPLNALRRYSGPGLVIQGGADESISTEEAVEITAALDERGQLNVIDEADHTFRHPDWRSEVFDITTRWLAGHLKPVT